MRSLGEFAGSYNAVHGHPMPIPVLEPTDSSADFEPALADGPRGAVARGCTLIFLLAGLAIGCDGRAGLDEPAAGAASEGSPPRSVNPVEGSGQASAHSPPSATDAGALLIDGAGTEPIREPPSLPVLMRQIGFETASEADLAEFVHVPPGAEGSAGTFGSNDEQVRVALIAYPNPRYAAPHVSDIRERVRIIPGAREAVAANGRWVIHVMAVDRATAVEVRDAMLELLGWPRPPSIPMGTDGG